MIWQLHPKIGWNVVIGPKREVHLFNVFTMEVKYKEPWEDNPNCSGAGYSVYKGQAFDYTSQKCNTYEWVHGSRFFVPLPFSPEDQKDLELPIEDEEDY